MDTNQIYELINRISSTYSVDQILVRAVVNAESSFNPSAIRTEPNGMSSYGLMQVTLPTARSVVGSITIDQLMIPDINLSVGISYLSSLLDKYGNIPDAVASYNAGLPRKNVSGQYINSKGSTNVNNYVNRVLGYYNQYKTEAGTPETTPLYLPLYLPSIPQSSQIQLIMGAIVILIVLWIVL